MAVIVFITAQPAKSKKLYTNENLNVTKAVAGTQIFSGTASLYTGVTTVTAGTLAGTVANAFGDTGNISIGGSGIVSLRRDTNTNFGKTTGGALYTVSTTATNATINVDQATVAGTGQAMTIGALTIASTAATANTNITGANNSSLATGAVTDTTALGGTVSFTNNIASTGTLTLASFTGTRTGTPTITLPGQATPS